MFIDINTDYSLLKSLIKIEDLVKYAQEKQWPFIGISDENAGGLLDFYIACTAANIKPVLGVTFNVSDDVESQPKGKIILYAKNVKGYFSLIKLFSRASVEGSVSGKSTILLEWLENIKQDLLVVVPFGQHPILSKVDFAEAIQKLFGEDLYYGLYDRELGIDDYWKREYGDRRYLFLSAAAFFKPEDALAYKTARAISERSTIERLFEMVYPENNILNAEDKYLSYPYKEYHNEFLAKINVVIPTPGLKVPKFPIPSQYKDSYEYLLHLCRKGYAAKKSEFDAKKVKDRMKVELDVIKKCKLADYFLMVYGICQYCDENDIPRNFSRGSCSGSLIAYFLDISRTNPLEFNLLFERFLNEDRTRPLEFEGQDYLTDAPDIDLDIGQLQRQQVIDFLREKYGHVAKICTYTTLSTKAVLKDVIKAHGKSEREAAIVSGYVESVFGRNDTLVETLAKNEKFKDWVSRNQKVYDVALKLEGIKKNLSIHAAGLLISDENIANRAPFIPAYTTGDEMKKDICAAYDLDFAAKAGLLKVDILGLRTLNCIQDTIKLIKSRYK